MAGFHHIEIWISHTTQIMEWSWLLSAVGFVRLSSWEQGETWGAGPSYLTLTTSPNLASEFHNRRNPGMNHIAFSCDTKSTVDHIMAAAKDHGWTALYHERYPFAGGTNHYAGWLENSAGFKVEVVAQMT